MSETPSEFGFKAFLEPIFTVRSVEMCIIALAFFFLSAGVAQADPTTYCYQGNTFTYISTFGTNTTSESLHGCITLASPLSATQPFPGAPLAYADIISFSFSDGVQSYAVPTELKSFSYAIIDGSITEWDLSIQQGSNSIYSSNYPGYSVFDDTQAYIPELGGVGALAEVSGNPGTWTESTLTTPEPPSFLLVFFGGIALAVLKLRRAC